MYIKPDAYKILSMAVENGVGYGIRRSYKHTDTPTMETMEEHIVNAVMTEICEWFVFENKDE